MKPFGTAWNLLLLGTSACGASTPAAATRVVAANVAALSHAPICFAAPGPNLNLTDRAQQLKTIEGCEDAARAEGARVVPFSGGHCVLATMAWTTQDSGDRRGDCARTWIGAECYSTAVHLKSLKVTLTRANGQAVAETTATISSSFGGFSKESIHALCTAAFHEFPQPLSHEQFDVPVE